jgi:hypothetical protein
MKFPAVSRPAHFGWAIVFAGLATPALAAPYCIQNQSLPPQCIYNDPGQCQADANKQGGVCSANPQQVTLNAGIGQYCLVTGTGVSRCVYPDRSTCLSDATRERGACTEAPTVAPSRAPDPYASVGGLLTARQQARQ